MNKITRVGKTSLAVTIPIEMYKELGWKEKQKVVVKRVRGGVEIKDWKKIYKKQAQILFDRVKNKPYDKQNKIQNCNSRKNCLR